MNSKESGYHTFFTNMANPLKMKIILSLRDSEKNVNELCDELKVEQSKVSHALSCLKGCKIVEVEQDGKQRIYSLNKRTVIPMLRILDKHSTCFCGKKSCKGCLMK
jgi:DNA-binding transcriptional ArsR family regulator